MLFSGVDTGTGSSGRRVSTCSAVVGFSRQFSETSVPWQAPARRGQDVALLPGPRFMFPSFSSCTSRRR